VSQAIVEGLAEPKAIGQLDAYKAAILWSQTEGFVCAPETSHAIAAVIDEANRAREEGKERTILFCYSGHGLMDLAGYDKYLSGKLTNFALPEEELAKSLNSLKTHPKPQLRKR